MSALQDAVMAIRDLIEAGEGIRCYPSGAVGFDDWDEARDAAQMLIRQWIDEDGTWRKMKREEVK